MTHPTDEELDALVERLDNLFAMLEEEGFYTKANTADFARKAITTIRSQLAEANTRADRAEQRVATLEAALAAQIKADAGIVDQMFYNPTTDADFSDDTNLNDWAGWATIGQLREWSSEAIRAQPHDRTALDRMLAEAREKALREAYQAVGRIVAGYELREDFRAEEVAGKCHDAILALIEAPDATR